MGTAGISPDIPVPAKLCRGHARQGAAGASGGTVVEGSADVGDCGDGALGFAEEARGGGTEGGGIGCAEFHACAPIHAKTERWMPVVSRAFCPPKSQCPSNENHPYLRLPRRAAATRNHPQMERRQVRLRLRPHDRPGGNRGAVWSADPRGHRGGARVGWRCSGDGEPPSFTEAIP